MESSKAKKIDTMERTVNIQIKASKGCIKVRRDVMGPGRRL